MNDDKMVRLDWNVNLTVEIPTERWDQLLKEAEEDEERNSDDTPEEHLAWQFSNDVEGNDVELQLLHGERAFIASADPPTVI